MAPHIKYPMIDGKKECGKCEKILDISEFDKARNHYTSKCKSCRKEYSIEYRQRPEVKAKTKAYHRAYMAITKNRKRAYKNQRKHLQKPSAKEKRNVARRIWVAKEKQKCVDYKGGGCSVCGYNKCLAALDFHHINPKEKNGYGTGALKAHWTFEKNKFEIDKCILVCVRCHREIHAGWIEI